MTVIYVDTLFLLNGIVDYLLLLAAARMAGEPLRRLRFGVGAVLGGVYAVAIFLPGFSFLNHPLCRVAAAVLMVLCAYGGSERLLRQTIIFFALACAFGGGVLAVGLLGKQGLSLSGGVFYSGMDLKIVLLSAAGCYAVMTIVFQKSGKHSIFTGELLTAKLTLMEKKVEFPVLVDTGNTLTDPISGRPVMVAEGAVLGTLFPPEHRPNQQDLLDPAQGMSRLGTGAFKGRFRLLPYRTVGVSRGLLLALKVDDICIQGKHQDMLVALSPTPVSDGGGYRALVGPIEGNG